MLSDAFDWQKLIDFDSCQIVFPPVICPTSGRPDIVFWSVNIKNVIIFELTLPAEELIEEAKGRKIDKYTYLKNLITESGWACELGTFEIGHRGFVAHSFAKMQTSLWCPYVHHSYRHTKSL